MKVLEFKQTQKQRVPMVLASVIVLSACTASNQEQQATTKVQEYLTSAHPEMLQNTVDNYQAALQFQDLPLQVGVETYLLTLENMETNEPIDIDNEEIRVLQQSNQPQDDPSREAPWIKAPTEVQRLSQPGTYEVTTRFTKPGKWTIQVLPDANPKKEGNPIIYFQVNVADSRSSS